MSTPEPSANVPERKGFHVPGWVLAVGGAVVLLVAALLIGRAVRDDGGDRREFGADGGRFVEHHGHRGLRILILLILVAAVIAAVVYITRRITSKSHTTETTSAEQLLAERFARGEIDEADYRSRRDALRT